MGKALYRKYRSKSLDEVVGQEHITDTLKNALKKGAISHAYLFTGPRGTGKTSIARILAHEINGLDYTDEQTHLDIIEIDAASNRRIDEIRELRDKVHIAPTSAKYKVYIIDEVHMLTREAFNALLKTLEEPPDHAVFMLATTEAHKIPDTIMSRTQRFTLRPIAADKAAKHLKSIAKGEKIKLSDEALQLLAEHGRGSFRDSISMLDQLSGLAKDEYSVEDVQLLLGVPTSDVIELLITSVRDNNQTGIFDAVRELKEQGIDASRTANAVSSTLRQSLVTSELLLSRSKTLQVLRNLVALTGSSGDFLGLELALLDVIEADDTEIKVQKPKVDSKPEPKPNMSMEVAVKRQEVSKQLKNAQTEEELAPTDAEKESQAESIIEARPFDGAVWQEMLNDVKIKHNTLYGVLRMAKPSVNDTLLVLTFNFGFHKKQLESSKNKPIVREYLQKYIGTADFSAVVIKAANNSVEKPAEKHVDNKSDEAIDNVSNIFGSAELLD